jgi:poly(hydroxyalkanoate) depolymerase family esterase
MRRIVRALAVVLALCLLPVAAAQAADAAPPPGQVVQRSYTNSAGTRLYDVYVPSTGAAGKPLMIWLHGCGGSVTVQSGHALAEVAEELGFTVAFPIEPASANLLQCWNWLTDANQHRDAGEPSIIAGITTSLRDELGSDPSRVYIGGYSAGGAMTTVMGATYPDLYAAIAPSAGAPYKVLDVAGLLAYQEMGPRARPLPVFMLQGLTDEISNYVLGRANILQWLGTDDYADDGTLNLSVSRLPAGIEPTVIQTDIALPVVIEHYRSGGCAIADFLTSPYEHGLNSDLFTFDEGLELQRTMMNFLFAHHLGGPGQACG